MDFWQLIMTPFSWLLKMFCQVFDSYGIALILFTVVIKVILFPFSYKGKKSMIKMNMASSKLKEIQKRCGNDRERYNQEVQKFYADNNISPMGGCGWTMIPMLILFPLYAIIRRPFKHMMRLTDKAISAVAEALNWTALKGTEFAAANGYNELILSSMMNSGNLEAAKSAAVTAGAAATGMFVINFNFFGLDLAQSPSWKFWEGGLTWQSVGLFLLPVISAALSFVSSKVASATNQMNKDQQVDSTSRTMLIMMPIISLWIGFSFPAGLCVYWISNSVLGIVQELILGKMLRKDYEEAQKAMAEQAAKDKEAEKERRRQAAEKKAAAIAANKGKYDKKKAQPQAKNKGVDLSASREGLRAYARGRAYDPNRYPITPYRDPDDKYKKTEEPVEALTEEEKELLAEAGVAIPEIPGETVEENAVVTETPAEETVAAEEETGDYEAAYEEESQD